MNVKIMSFAVSQFEVNSGTRQLMNWMNHKLVH